MKPTPIQFQCYLQRNASLQWKLDSKHWHLVADWCIFAMHHLIKGFICFFSAWMCWCQINDLPLPSRGNAPNMLQTQCPSHESSFPSNWLLRLHLLCQRNKDNMKNNAWASAAVFDCQGRRTNALFLLHVYVYQTKGLQTVNAVSFRCCSNSHSIPCSSAVVSIGSPTFLLCLGLNSQREA